MYLQTIHGKPILVGKAARTGSDADRYIRDMAVLRAWLEFAPLECSPEIQDSLRQLEQDGFTTIIVHSPDNLDKREIAALDSYFEHVSPIYRDQMIKVFALSDVINNLPCPTP
jgi:hypothetical protein